MAVVGKSMNDVYRRLCGTILTQGKPVANTTELKNCTFTLLDIEDNVAAVRPDFSMLYLLGELVWYFSKRRDLEFISKFSKFWEHLAVDGECNSAYGDIVFQRYGFDQLELCEEILREHPESRRAVVNFNVPNLKRKDCPDEICTVMLQFLLRDGKLDCTCVMRSNDIWFGVPYDTVFFTWLQQILADRLGVEYGVYTLFAVSLHAYDKDAGKVSECWRSSDKGKKYLTLDRRAFFDNFEELERICELDKPKDTLLDFVVEKGIIR